MKKILYISLLILLASCSNMPVKHYQYTNSGTVKPASIKGAFIDANNRRTFDSGFVHITRIDGNYIENIDSPTIFTPSTMKWTEYKLSPGKHIITSALDSASYREFDTVLNAQEGENYTLVANDERKGILSRGRWSVWITDSKGRQITTPQHLLLTTGRR